jgi:hypothetical protein
MIDHPDGRDAAAQAVAQPVAPQLLDRQHLGGGQRGQRQARFCNAVTALTGSSADSFFPAPQAALAQRGDDGILRTAGPAVQQQLVVLHGEAEAGVFVVMRGAVEGVFFRSTTLTGAARIAAL